MSLKDLEITSWKVMKKAFEYVYGPATKKTRPWRNKYKLERQVIPLKTVGEIVNIQEYNRIVKKDGLCPWCGAELLAWEGYLYCKSDKGTCYSKHLNPLLGNADPHEPNHLAHAWAEGKLLQCVPFEDLPLYVNVESDYAKEILQERFQNGT